MSRNLLRIVLFKEEKTKNVKGNINCKFCVFRFMKSVEEENREQGGDDDKEGA